MASLIVQAFKLNYPDFISRPLSNEQNPLTQNGVLLGRKLFYGRLSADSSIKCASCHSQNNAFSSPSTGLKNEYQGIILKEILWLYSIKHGRVISHGICALSHWKIK